MSDNEYNKEKQEVLIRYLLSNESIFQRCHNILKPEYFDNSLVEAVKVIVHHANTFKAIPKPDQLKAECGYEVELIDGVREQDVDWALTNIEHFCQRAALVQAVMEAPDFIEKGDYGAVEKSIDDARLISLQKDIGTDYFLDPRERLERMRVKNLIPTGWRDIDNKLYGGLNRGEITIFTGGSGAGKSLFLQNIALNWVEGVTNEYNNEVKTWAPMNAIYISLELSEELVSKRMDTMVTGVDAREIFKKLDDVEMKVKVKGKKCGKFFIKYMPAGSSCNDIRAYLSEFTIQTGIKPDVLAVDYLDLLHPNQGRINVGDLFIKDKFVTEELRALAAELDVLCVTASQLNRSAVNDSNHNQAMIAGGISKIQTADNVISIYTTPAMRERGEYQLTFLKTRSSAGVDSKVYLGFDQTSLRIGNLEHSYREDGEPEEPTKDPKSMVSSGRTSSIMDHVKGLRKRPEDFVKKPEAEESPSPDQDVDNKNVESDHSDSSGPADPFARLNRLKKLQDEGKV